jgi:hypothetical protein
VLNCEEFINFVLEIISCSHIFCFGDIYAYIINSNNNMAGARTYEVGAAVAILTIGFSNEACNRSLKNMQLL